MTKRQLAGQDVDELDDPALTARLTKLSVRAGDRIRRRVFGDVTILDGPAGACMVAWTGRGVCLIDLASAFGNDLDAFVAHGATRFERPFLAGAKPPAGLAKALLSGNGHAVALDFGDLGSFAQDVLSATSDIPRGEVRTYSWVAGAIGRPKAVRAVGTALAHNPIPFLVPCHRVVRNDGKTGNYGFGPSVKIAILGDEGVDLPGLEALVASGSRFVGSKTTHIVCVPTCRHVRRIASVNRVEFPSLEAANRAKFRACLDCRPVPGPAAVAKRNQVRQLH